MTQLIEYPKYHKIPTAWSRDPDTNFKTLLGGIWASHELAWLHDKDWVWTEKVDGTNVRVCWDSETQNLSFYGRTDRAEMPLHLERYLEATFTREKMRNAFPDARVCLYGEGYGAKIQKGGKYLGKEVGFVLFDVLMLPAAIWLTRESVADIGHKLMPDVERPVVPEIGRGSLLNAIDTVRGRYLKSSWGDFVAEGLVMRPALELKTRMGERIIAKIKGKDFPDG